MLPKYPLTHTHTHIENTWLASWITAIYFHAGTNAAFLLAHFGETAAVPWASPPQGGCLQRPVLGLVCVPVVPLALRMEQLQLHPISVQSHKAWSEELDAASLQNKTWEEKSTLKRWVEARLGFLEVNKEESGFIFSAFVLNSVTELLLTVDGQTKNLYRIILRLNSPANFRCPDSKTGSHTRLRPAGAFKGAHLFQSTRATLFKHLYSHTCTFLWIRKHAQASESSLCFFIFIDINTHPVSLQ